jgi:cytochrome P450
MALWFGSVHVLTTTICFAIHDICNHPEYVNPLRKELDNENWQDAVIDNKGKSLPLLDSFLKESMRTTPVESMSSRRMALEPFSLSDGTHVKAGDWLCTAPRAMMRDPANYTQPLEFQGFRHVEAGHLETITPVPPHQHPGGNPSELTQLPGWQVWGTGRMAW